MAQDVGVRPPNVVLSDVGLHLMDDIRNVVVQMQSEEDRLDAERSLNYERSIATTILCVYMASAAAALGLILVANYILREMEIRRKHAAQLLEREEWFRVTMTSLGDAVIATDDHGTVNYLNPLAEQLIGKQLMQVKGQLIGDVFPIFNEQTMLPVENPVAKEWSWGELWVSQITPCCGIRMEPTHPLKTAHRPSVTTKTS